MRDILLLDGGLGQEIFQRAGKPAHPLWSARVMMDNPEIVKEVHQDFIKAGAKIITVNSYSCTPTRLLRDGQLQWFERLQQLALKMASEARDELGALAENVQIAGCLPPLIGSYTTDERSFQELKEEYRQISTIQAAEVDIFIIETISNIKEARAATEAALESRKPVILSFTLSDKIPHVLRSGETIEEALDAISDYPLSGLSFNCSFPETISQGMKAVQHLKIPYGGYANGFTSVEELKPGGTVNVLSAREDLDEKKYAHYAMDWVRSGAAIVGGCCEVGPSYIKYLQNELLKQNYHIVSLK
ncbi:homocysteine S-methyltransferase [Catalinimonas alkaloidigena]|uniref:homocysteine S-methyltransferase family protein n=1 Tax=Catalinimonas alkaloidigena TaxID=1075417 RepID=UPI002404E5AF|nr:homocysteine S-methyltransferase family protein [Catalinimonas alkaloidigena]MDF9799351.1 homocysteine S-methyltransferase [Catalinimonas alkaloidigena]